jgi:hypothetical protein
MNIPYFLGHPKLKNNPVFTRVTKGVPKKCGKQEIISVRSNWDMEINWALP